jgi:serine/threonine protein kinase
MTVVVHDGAAETRALEVVEDPVSNVYEFAFSARYVGIVVLEISLGGEQIPESPLRVEVTERDCSEGYSYDLHEADEHGNCVCRSNTISIRDSCIPLEVLIPAIICPLALIAALGVYYYVKKKTRAADSVWYVKPNQLQFSTPPVVIGQGTFGLVLLAEYRGTKVAVKHVLPPRDRSQSEQEAKSSSGLGLKSSSVVKSGVFEKSPTMEESSTSENQAPEYGVDYVQDALDVLVEEEDEELGRGKETDKANDGEPTVNSRRRVDGRSSAVFAKKDSKLRLGTTSKTATSSAASTIRHPLIFLRGKNSYEREKSNFIKEMRLLSKLRHPCVTTVMGAVIEQGQDPLLIMEYMDHGSLRDILGNETMFMEGELVLHILRDVAQGIRFLHSANPPVIHGDLKSANILVDSKFRAKVADFGLSHKKQDVAMGTPFWMAPELLRGESLNTTASDMYAIGIILYELYSRKEPYEGEDDEDVLKLVCNKNVNKRPPIPEACPPKIAKLMKFLLMTDPSLRPTAEVFDNRLAELNAANVEPFQLHLSRQLKKEQPCDSGSEFLYQVFPRHIADVLKNGGKVEPESHEIVTIFFSDIVGFTAIASSFPPLKVSSMLDRLYLKLDSLARKHDLFKIETIGDAYMCAANLAKDQSEDHVKRIAEFALEAVEAALKTPVDEDDPSMGNVCIRVGFHSGPVVSNVVGSLNPRYGIFGDTVNVSSRMESTSAAGQIHCSERSAHLLMKQAPKISVTKRGETEIKGKGVMTTYWVH